MPSSSVDLPKHTVSLIRPAIEFLGVYMQSGPERPTIVTDPGEVLGSAGLSIGDILISINGEPVTGAVHGCGLLRSSPTGQQLQIVFARPGENWWPELQQRYTNGPAAAEPNNAAAPNPAGRGITLGSEADGFLTNLGVSIGEMVSQFSRRWSPEEEPKAAE